jgi:peptidoglycan hydrolase CwlO-like protein
MLISRKVKLFIVLCIAVSSAFVMPNFIFGQDQTMESKCAILVEYGCQAQDKSQCQKSLEECEKYYSVESEKVANDMATTSQEKKTLQSKISSLNQKIKELNYRINQSNLVIKDLTVQIFDTEDSITQNTLKIEDLKDKLSVILRTFHQEDQRPLIEVLLAEDDISDFFDNMVALDVLNSKNSDLLGSIKTLKYQLEDQKTSLDEEKDSMEQTVKIHEAQKQESSKTKNDQQYYLNITEQEYQKQLQQKKDIDKKMAEIRARLFQLVGVTNAPTFGEALDIAKSVASIIGIRPAFLLAVISQESAIGRNVGQCVLTDPSTGSGKRIKTGAVLSRVMKPTRDVKPFITITTSLGRDPYDTPVSCPLSVGYGGAMGPAQFIASTWMLYADKIKATLGKTGDPWAIKDSFTASAIYLADLGATAKTSSAESNAASRYYGGSSSYARSVMGRASCIQSFIDSGTMTLSCENLIF